MCSRPSVPRTCRGAPAAVTASAVLCSGAADCPASGPGLPASRPTAAGTRDRTVSSEHPRTSSERRPCPPSRSSRLRLGRARELLVNDRRLMASPPMSLAPLTVFLPAAATATNSKPAPTTPSRERGSSPPSRAPTRLRDARFSRQERASPRPPSPLSERTRSSCAASESRSSTRAGATRGPIVCPRTPPSRPRQL
jgi:hypothetical protein